MLPTIGVILAGGSSRRMSQPKAWLRLPNGQTFLENALALLSSLTEMQIVAGGEPETTEGVRFSWQRDALVPLREIQSRGRGRLRSTLKSQTFKPPYVHIMDLHPGEGPLAGIEAALSTRLGSGYLVIATDQPKLSTKLLQRLLGGDGDRIRAFQVEGRIIPLPVYMPQSALPAVSEAMTGDLRSLHQFIAINNPELIGLPPDDLPGLQSINTPEEYQDLLADWRPACRHVPSRDPT